MSIQIRNPAAVKLLIGWVVIGTLTLGGLAAAGFMPPHPGFQSIFLPAFVGVMAQGFAAMSAAKRGNARLGWIILLTPQVLMLLLVLVFFILFAIGIS